MATNDSAETRNAEERVERAKASLLSRLDLLKQKLTDARHKVDLREQIALHPLPAVGIAFVLGALAGLQRTHAASAAGATSRPLVNAAFAGIAALGLRFVREVALSQLGHVAKEWWTEHDNTPSSEARASHIADVEPFLEH